MQAVAFFRSHYYATTIYRIGPPLIYPHSIRAHKKFMMVLSGAQLILLIFRTMLEQSIELALPTDWSLQDLDSQENWPPQILHRMIEIPWTHDGPMWGHLWEIQSGENKWPHMGPHHISFKQE